uniref:Artemin n=1 Tax=Pelusios castaneus TaxID=367368 RepID=A0A8C8SSZ4_9SAUR
MGLWLLGQIQHSGDIEPAGWVKDPVFPYNQGSAQYKTSDCRNSSSCLSQDHCVRGLISLLGHPQRPGLCPPHPSPACSLSIPETHMPKRPSLHVHDNSRNLLPYTSPGLAKSRQKRRPLASSHLWEQPGEQECQLRSLLLRVKDLGLGYDSEETILFKYCSGSCPKARTNHDLTLSLLLQKSEIPALGEEKMIGDPCCRPTHYEDVAFLDNSHRWHEVEKLSASACSCIG